MEKTLGEIRIRTSFNPSSSDKVNDIKQKFAKMINDINDVDKEDSEHARLAAKAMTEIENAAHWAVKFETYKL